MQTYKKAQLQKRNQSGIGHLLILVVVAVIAVVGLVGWNIAKQKDKQNGKFDGDGGNAQSSADSENEAELTIQNFGLASILEATNFTKQATQDYAQSGMKGLYVFGDKLPGDRLNPNFEFSSINADVKVISAIDGVVGFIKQQSDSKDYEVFLQPQENSIWQVGYDHITNLKVSKGQAVKAGDVIGNAAVQNNGLNRFEFQVNKQSGSDGLHICPSTLLASGVKDKVLADLKATQEKWQTFSGLSLYDIAGQSPIGCLQKTLTPDQAQGTPEQ